MDKGKSLSGLPPYYFPNVWGSEQISDLLLFLNRYLHINWYYTIEFWFLQKGAKAAQQFCKSYFLSSSVMYMIRYNLSLMIFDNYLNQVGFFDVERCA